MTLNKALASFAIVLTVLFLSAWTPVETSNKSIVRLSLDGKDFCSGVIVERIDADFVYMATAAHCADATSKIKSVKVELPNGQVKEKFLNIFPPLRIKTDIVDEEGNVTVSIEADGRFVKLTNIFDVAIYRVYAPVEMVPWEPARFGDGHVKYGDKVYSMGMPFALWGTVSDGIVSKPRVGKVQGIPEFIPQDAIVHTAYMKPGISGGGLFNDRGELIGLTNWGQSGGPYLATRVSHVIDLLKEIKNENVNGS